MKIADETVISGKRAISKSYAKINLTLDVLGRMENGYHEIETVMQTVGLFDLVIVDRTERHIIVNTNLKFLGPPDKNIAYKAAQAFFKKSGISGGAKILIHKNIPVAAGLAGGSSNAAATLICLNMLYGRPFSDGELLSLGAELGADVPFCMIGGTCLCKGIGDITEPLEAFPKKHVLIVKPPVSISTAEIYDRIDQEEILPHPSTADFLQALSERGYAPELMFNVMERVSARQYPVISGIREKLIKNGASAAMMSGSGSSVFGLFDDYNAAKESADSFSYIYKEVYLTMTN